MFSMLRRIYLYNIELKPSWKDFIVSFIDFRSYIFIPFDIR